MYINIGLASSNTVAEGLEAYTVVILNILKQEAFWTPDIYDGISRRIDSNLEETIGVTSDCSRINLNGLLVDLEVESCTGHTESLSNFAVTDGDY